MEETKRSYSEYLKRTRYALTEREKGIVERTYTILDAVMSKYHLPPREEQSYEDINVSGRLSLEENIKKEFAEALAKKKISVSKAVKMAERVLSGKWYVLQIERFEPTGDRGYHRPEFPVYCLASSDDVDGKTLDPINYSRFYDIDNNPKYMDITYLTDDEIKKIDAEALEAIGLSLEYKKISFYEWVTLSYILSVFGEVKDAGVFWTLPSNPTIEALSNLTTKLARSSAELVVDKFSGDKNKNIIMITTKGNANTSVSISADVYSEALISNPNADKFLRFASYQWEIQGKPKSFNIPFEEFVKVRGMEKDRSQAASDCRDALSVIKWFKFIMDMPDGSLAQREYAQEADLIAGRGKNSYIHIMWSDAFYQVLLNNKTYIKYNPKLQKIPNNKGNAYKFADYIQKHYRMNMGKGNQNVISVKTLLAQSNLPPAETFKYKSQIAQKIIEPFTNALNYLEDIDICTHHFAYSKSSGLGDEISAEDLNRLFTDYDFFSTLMIKFDLIDKPDYSNLLEHKEQRKALAEKKAIAKSKAIGTAIGKAKSANKKI